MEKEINIEERNTDGTFKKGVSGNPKGMKKGTVSLVAMLKRKLQEVPQGETKQYAEQLIDIILEKAITDKETKMLDLVLKHVDGMPRQRVGLEGGEEGSPLVISVESQEAVDAALKSFLGSKEETETKAGEDR